MANDCVDTTNIHIAGLCELNCGFRISELQAQDGKRVQNEVFQLEMGRSLRRLKVILTEGYDHFAAVYSVHATEA